MNALRIFRWALYLGFQDFQNFWKNWRIWVGAHLLRVTTSAATWVLFGRLLGSDERLYFLLIGQVVIAGPQYVGWTVPAFTWDRMFIGTYPLLVAAPVSLVPAMMGRTSIWLLNGIVTSLVTLVILFPVFGLAIPVSGLFWMPALIIVVCASYYGFMFFVGTIVNWIPQTRNVVHNSVTTAITAICGVVVPLTFWPSWVKPIAQVLPVTHGLQSIRLFMESGLSKEVAIHAILEGVIGLGWLISGILMLDRTVNMARRRGNIELI
jgi:ABC-2 type transport system permease protein